MRTATAKDLRQRTSELLDDVAAAARSLYISRKAIAVLAPRSDQSQESRPSPRHMATAQDMRDVKRWLADDARRESRADRGHASKAVALAPPTSALPRITAVVVGSARTSS